MKNSKRNRNRKVKVQQFKAVSKYHAKQLRKRDAALAPIGSALRALQNAGYAD